MVKPEADNILELQEKQKVGGFRMDGMDLSYGANETEIFGWRKTLRIAWSGGGADDLAEFHEDKTCREMFGSKKNLKIHTKVKHATRLRGLK